MRLAVWAAGGDHPMCNPQQENVVLARAKRKKKGQLFRPDFTYEEATTVS